MKKFIEHQYDEIGRQYLFDDGSKYYSVTTALSYTKNQQFLEEWRKKVGKQKAEQLTKIAGIIGTDMHFCLENYLLKKEVVYPNAVVKMLCRQIIPFVDKKISHVYSTEEVLYSDKLQLAGTVDAVVDYLINGTTHISILDFKTSNRIPKVEWVQDYFIQMCLYAMMIFEMKRIKPIQKGVLLFAFKKQRSNKNQIIIDLVKYKNASLKRVNLFHSLIEKKLDN